MHAVLAGYYPKDGPNKSNLEAQIDMIDESLRWAGIDQATEVCPCMYPARSSDTTLTGYCHCYYKISLLIYLPQLTAALMLDHHQCFEYTSLLCCKHDLIFGSGTESNNDELLQ